MRNWLRALLADTGHLRGSNDLLKATVRIATGGTPAGGSGKERFAENYRAHCQRALPAKAPLPKGAGMP